MELVKERKDRNPGKEVGKDETREANLFYSPFVHPE